MQRREKQSELPKTPLRFIIYTSRDFKGVAFLSILAVSLGAGLSPLINYLLKLLIDAAESGNADRVSVLVLLFPVAHFFVQNIFRLSGFFGSAFTTGLKKKTNDVLVDKLFEHSHTYFINRFAGSLLSRIGNVTSAIETFIPELLWTFIPGVVSFAVVGGIIFSADPAASTLFFLLVLALLIVNRFFSKKKRALAYAGSEAGTKLRGIVVDILTNISATRQYVQTKAEKKRVFEASTDWRDKSRISWRYSEVMLTVNSLIIFLFSVAIFYLLVTRWTSGLISTGTLVFIATSYSQILLTLMFIGRTFNRVAQTFGEMEEGLKEVLMPIEIVDAPNAKKLQAKGGQIDWQDVSFSYEGVTVFDGFNLTIKGGQRIGLVGQSGAGKTTFVSLLLRQHDIESGSIRIDGQDIRGVTQYSLRKGIAVVPQEPLLFHRSIRENIAYGKPGATMKEIEAVAKKAEAHSFINTLPEGYDTLVGERGVKLSGGQKQRIAIARAMLKDAPILILDEATSALDSESEVAIQKALHTLMKGKTVIAVAHRLSTLREMDRIIVLDQGKIVEDGNHKELVKNKKTYARLWEHQAGGFLTDG